MVTGHPVERAHRPFFAPKLYPPILPYRMQNELPQAQRLVQRWQRPKKSPAPMDEDITSAMQPIQECTEKFCI